MKIKLTSAVGLLRRCAAASVVTVAATVLPLPSSAEESDAKALFKAMSDYIAAQSELSFSYDANLEIVTADLMKVGFASSGTVSLARPDKIRVTRTGGFADVDMAYDGEVLSVLGKELNVFTSTETKGSVDDLIDTLRFEYGAEAPAADLLSSNPYEAMMSNVTSAMDLGSGVIRGQVCDHLAFRTREVDWQIWIAQGDRPYPCRFEITSKLTAMAPSYRIDVSDWKAGSGVVATSFRIESGNAKIVKIDEFEGLDEVKPMLSEGTEQ
jgi:hypothetical protein